MHTERRWSGGGQEGGLAQCGPLQACAQAGPLPEALEQRPVALLGQLCRLHETGAHDQAMAPSLPAP